jgi:hypothetical protein
VFDLCAGPLAARGCSTADGLGFLFSPRDFVSQHSLFCYHKSIESSEVGVREDPGGYEGNKHEDVIMMIIWPAAAFGLQVEEAIPISDSRLLIKQTLWV